MSVASFENIFSQSIDFLFVLLMGFPGGAVVKNLLAMQETQETWVQSLGQEDPLEQEILLQYSCLENFMDRAAW